VHADIFDRLADTLRFIGTDFTQVFDENGWVEERRMRRFAIESLPQVRGVLEVQGFLPFRDSFRAGPHDLLGMFSAFQSLRRNLARNV
jgi:hypothetical protein